MFYIKTKSVLLFFFLLLIPGQAQKWGKVSDDMLSMTQIAEDPEADAVYLFDKGEMTIKKDFTLEFLRHYRIKVLTESGKEFANQHIAYYAENKIYNLEAQSFSPEGKKYKLDEDNIFEQEYKGRIHLKKKTFAVPGVEVGSVIECKYRLLSDNLYLLPVWNFQNEAFTLRSEISATLLPGFNYTSFTTNIGSAVPQPTIEEILIPGANFKKQVKYTWQMEKIPALKPEPYVKAYDDYFSAIYFQLTTYNNGYQTFNFTKTWKNLSEDILKNYDPYLRKTDRHSQLVNSVCSEFQEPIDQVKAIYHYVQKEIETNAKSILFFSEIEEPEEVLEKKEARAATKNLLLIYLLNHINIPAIPVFICTRDEGSLKSQWISVLNFNHLIVAVNVGNKRYYLDTKEKYYPFGGLPEDCLVNNGLQLVKNNTKFINIPQPKIKNERHINTNVQILENGDLKLKTTFMFTGIDAGNQRHNLNIKGPDKYIKDKIDDRLVNAVIDTFEITALGEIDEPLSYSVVYHVSDYLQQADMYRILKLPLLYMIEENPFVSDKRRLPIDFNYTHKTNETIAIEIPDSITVIELPQSAKARLPKVSFSTSCSQSGNIIKYTRNFNLLRLQCSVSEYDEVKRLYRKMVEADQSAILLSSK